MQQNPPPIRAEVLERHPLMTAGGYETFRRIHEHRHAPRWTYAVGDRVTQSDLEGAQAFRALLGRRARPLAAPSDDVLEQVERLRSDVLYYHGALPARVDPTRDWAALPTLTRRTLFEQVELMVPLAADLSRLITYETSGTTGPMLRIPTHPGFNAQNHVLAEHAFRVHGVRLAPQAGETAALGLSAQASTYTFASVFSVWNQAGFAKVNLKRSEWPEGVQSARRFCAELAPRLLTGEPQSFAEAMAWELPLRPLGMLSTATALAPALQEKLAQHFNCPVLDWYSLSETGPIAHSAADGQGFQLFPSDLFVEILDEAQRPVSLGERGEIVITTFRNPFLPLLRYRTGDSGRLIEVAAAGGVERRLIDLVARQSASFRSADGDVINSVDIARVLHRTGIYVQHECVQRADGSIDLRVQPLIGMDPQLAALEAGLRQYFGSRQVLRLHVDADLQARAAGKLTMYRSELSSDPVAPV
jgi:phenylacetate-CoA ligase